MLISLSDGSGIDVLQLDTERKNRHRVAA